MQRAVHLCIHEERAPSLQQIQWVTTSIRRGPRRGDSLASVEVSLCSGSSEVADYAFGESALRLNTITPSKRGDHVFDDIVGMFEADRVDDQPCRRRRILRAARA